MLGAPAVIVSEGGVGRPIDEIVLNAALFERARRAGRRARSSTRSTSTRKPGLARTLERGLAPPRHPAARRAAVPADPVEPDAGDGPRGRPRRDDPPGPGPRPGHRRRRDRRDGAASTCSSGSGRGSLVIVPGRPRGRDPARSSARTGIEARRRRATARSGLVLTGGYRPRPAVLDAIRRADLFATLVPEDTYAVASEVHDLLVKTHAADRGKIERDQGARVGVPVHRPRARGGHHAPGSSADPVGR